MYELHENEQFGNLYWRLADGVAGRETLSPPSAPPGCLSCGLSVRSIANWPAANPSGGWRTDNGGQTVYTSGGDGVLY